MAAKKTSGKAPKKSTSNSGNNSNSDKTSTSDNASDPDNKEGAEPRGDTEPKSEKGIPKPKAGEKKEKGIPEVVRKGMIRILKAAQRAINKRDANRLDLLSERAIQDAAIYQDQDSLSLAVVVLAISKLIKREGEDRETEYPKHLAEYLSSARFSLDEKEFDSYRDKIKKIFEFISTIDKGLKLYIDKVIEKAQVKKGSSLYERGISVARAAELLGIGQWELMSYIGKTKIHDKAEAKNRVGERIRLARNLFKKE